MGLEAFIPSKDDDEDESLADFVQRRLGQEALDQLAEPLMSGIYNTDVESQSLMATFPRFRALEQKYGSLTRGMLAMQRQRKAHSSSNAHKPSMFMSFKDGMQTRINTLVDRLTGDCRLNTGLQSIEATAGGYRLRLDDGSWIDTQQVVLALPAYASATLLAGLAPASAALLRSVDYVSIGTLSLAYHKSDLRKVPDGFGVVIPQSAGRDINAITVSSTKFNHRAPDDIVLLRAFYGGARTPHTYQQDDETLQATVRRELKTIYGITADPIFTRVLRNQRATIYRRTSRAGRQHRSRLTRRIDGCRQSVSWGRCAGLRPSVPASDRAHRARSESQLNHRDRTGMRARGC
jgi:protoporphyrinogen/coproporphyrinogen III oxidase